MEDSHSSSNRLEDEIGFYEDADGLYYFLDRNGQEYYPTHEFPPDADWGFFADDTTGVLFVDSQGAEHYPPIPLNAVDAGTTPSQALVRSESFQRRNSRNPNRDLERTASFKTRSRSRGRDARTRSRSRGRDRSKSRTRQDDREQARARSRERMRSKSKERSQRRSRSKERDRESNRDTSINYGANSKRVSRGKNNNNNRPGGQFTASEKGMTNSTRNQPDELNFMDFAAAAEEAEKKKGVFSAGAKNLLTNIAKTTTLVAADSVHLVGKTVNTVGSTATDVVVGTSKFGVDALKTTVTTASDGVKVVGKTVGSVGSTATDVVVGTSKLGVDAIVGAVEGTRKVGKLAMDSTADVMAKGVENMSLSQATRASMSQSMATRTNLLGVSSAATTAAPSPPS